LFVRSYRLLLVDVADVVDVVDGGSPVLPPPLVVLEWSKPGESLRPAKATPRARSSGSSPACGRDGTLDPIGLVCRLALVLR
jgi:hypothetical protein